MNASTQIDGLIAKLQRLREREMTHLHTEQLNRLTPTLDALLRETSQADNDRATYAAAAVIVGSQGADALKDEWHAARRAGAKSSFQSFVESRLDGLRGRDRSPRVNARRLKLVP